MSLGIFNTPVSVVSTRMCKAVLAIAFQLLDGGFNVPLRDLVPADLASKPLLQCFSELAEAADITHPRHQELQGHFVEIWYMVLRAFNIDLNVRASFESKLTPYFFHRHPFNFLECFSTCSKRLHRLRGTDQNRGHCVLQG